MGQILDGTWGSPAPEEILDAELMRVYGWSWEDLQHTPAYVRRVCADWMAARNREEAKHAP
jgi:hypothetical protein